jgi:hypothetical protein
MIPHNSHQNKKSGALGSATEKDLDCNGLTDNQTTEAKQDNLFSIWQERAMIMADHTITHSWFMAMHVNFIDVFSQTISTKLKLGL